MAFFNQPSFVLATQCTRVLTSFISHIIPNIFFVKDERVVIPKLLTICNEQNRCNMRAVQTHTNQYLQYSRLLNQKTSTTYQTTFHQTSTTLYFLRPNCSPQYHTIFHVAAKTRSLAIQAARFRLDEKGNNAHSRLKDRNFLAENGMLARQAACLSIRRDAFVFRLQTHRRRKKSSSQP